MQHSRKNGAYGSAVRHNYRVLLPAFCNFKQKRICPRKHVRAALAARKRQIRQQRPALLHKRPIARVDLAVGKPCQLTELNLIHRRVTWLRLHPKRPAKDLCRLHRAQKRT